MIKINKTKNNDGCANITFELIQSMKNTLPDYCCYNTYLIFYD